MNGKPVLYRMAGTLSVLFALLLIISVLSGCKPERGAKLYVRNDGADAVHLQLYRIVDWPGFAETEEKVGTSIILLPHSGTLIDDRLRFKESYELHAFDLKDRITMIAVSRTLVADAAGGEVRVVVGDAAPVLTAGPDLETIRAQRALLSNAFQFLATSASVVYWVKYWRRRYIPVQRRF